MRIAVTGASGFIGRHVTHCLLERGAEVVAVTRCARNIAFTHPNLSILESDLTRLDTTALKVIASCDSLIHLAWDGLPNYLNAKHLEYELPNQINFLGALFQLGLTHLVITGTCFEYGPQNGLLSEHLECRPDNAYGKAKLNLLNWVQQQQPEFDFEFTWARLFYLFGAGQSQKSLFTQLMQAIEREDKSFDMSPGDQIRDFLNVILAAGFLCDFAQSRINGGIVNVCSGRPITVRQIVEDWLAERRASLRLNLGVYPYPSYEPMSFWGDNEKLKSLIS